MTDERPSRRRTGTYPLPLPEDIPAGRTTPWIAAMEKTGRDPFNPLLGTASSAYPPDADTMEKWLRTDSETWDLYRDIAEAIDAGTIDCIKVRNRDGSVDLFASLIKVADADETAARRLGTSSPNAVGTDRATAARERKPATPGVIREELRNLYTDHSAKDLKPPNVIEASKAAQRALAPRGVDASLRRIQEIAEEEEFRGLRWKPGRKRTDNR